MSNCALLLFAKSTLLETNSKKIVVSDKENASIWNILNAKTSKIAQKSKLPFFIADESVQVGNSFGERISNAIQNIFDKGFEKVIVIGNDCPELSTFHIKSAAEKLLKNDFVFGPDFKGGAYLLGISKSEFDTIDFENFKWQSTSLFKDLTTFYNQKRVSILPFLNDVNDFFSFKKAVHNLKFKSKLKTHLLTFLTFINQSFDVVISKIIIFKFLFLKYRGPPAVRF